VPTPRWRISRWAYLHLEAAELLASLQEAVVDKGVRFHTGVSYRQPDDLAQGIRRGEDDPPHDIHGKKITRYLPQGTARNFC